MAAKTAPDLSTPSNVQINSNPRSKAMTTTSPGCTPSVRRACAIWLARRSTSAYVNMPPAPETATASGKRSTQSSKKTCGISAKCVRDRESVFGCEIREDCIVILTEPTIGSEADYRLYHQQRSGYERRCLSSRRPADCWVTAPDITKKLWKAGFILLTLLKIAGIIPAAIMHLTCHSSSAGRAVDS